MRSYRRSEVVFALPEVLPVFPVFYLLLTVGAHKMIEGYSRDITPVQSTALAVSYAKCAWIGSVFYPLSVTFPKLSICALYLRVFVTWRTRLITKLTAGLLVANCIAFFLVQIFFCNPPSYYWQSYAIKSTARVNLERGKCLDNEAATLAQPPPQILTDLILLALPIPTVWHIQASHARKLGLTFTFLMAGIGLIGCVARYALYLATRTNTSIRMFELFDKSEPHEKTNVFERRSIFPSINSYRPRAHDVSYCSLPATYA